MTSVFNDFYVDDFLKSMPNEREAALLAAEMRELLQRGGFELTKWASNRPEALRYVSDSSATDAKDHLSTLGLKWDSKLDTFSFAGVQVEGPASRRQKPDRCTGWTVHLPRCPLRPIREAASCAKTRAQF